MKTYVINLLRAEARRKYIVNHLKSLNIDFKIINAVDGNTLTEKDIAQYTDTEKVKQSPYFNKRSNRMCNVT